MIRISDDSAKALILIVNVVNGTELNIREILYGEGYSDSEIESIEEEVGMDFEGHSRGEDKDE